MPLKKLKPKKCRSCKDTFNPCNSFQYVCAPKCAVAYVVSQKEKKAKAEIKKRQQKERVSVMVRKNSLKTRAQWLKEAQAQFNKYIRLRDTGPCISCQRHHTGQYHAGHYLTVGAHPELRFNEDNCHKQCAPCNNHLSGNIAAFRINLVKKIGQRGVDILEGPHSLNKYTIEEIKEIKAKYRDKSKELES